MNRPIKFRAWDHKNGKMYNSDSGYFRLNKGAFDIAGHIQRNVMQFTGLLDKNGKEIYEGDIVEVWGYTAENGSRIDSKKYSVSWQNEYPAFDFDGWEGESNGLGEVVETGEYEYEIIGNVWESPELLKD